MLAADPLTMAQAYATFAARGLHCDPRPVVAIDDSNGHQLKTYPQQCQQVIAAPVADAVNDVLRGVQSPTGFGANLILNQESAAKTGTNDNNMSVWYMGYTPNLATASMIAGANSMGHWITLNGQLLNGTLLDYRVPRADDVAGRIECRFVENADGPGPFGAKGAGEGSLVPVSPAVGNALARLTGIRFRELPLTPERVWRALRQHQSRRTP